MSRVYAKIHCSLQILFALFTIFILSGCANNYRVPWGTPTTDSGIVTNDPNSLPDIGWQTQSQRHVLVEQRKAQGEEAPLPDVTLIPPIPKPENVTPPGKITVSLLLPLSGKKADLGQSMLKAAQMALFDIGSADFELVPQDTRSTRDGAIAAANEAVRTRASLILGPVFADDLKAVKPIANAANIPVISFTTDWTLADGNTYIMGFLPFTQVSRVLKYAQERGYSRLAIFAPQTEYCDVVVRTAQKNNVSITKISRYAPQQSDLSTLVKDFAESSKGEFDMLMLPLGSEGLRSLVTVMGQSGIDQSKIKFIGTGLWDDATLTSDPSLFGGWFSAPDPGLRADFEKRFESNYGAPPLRLSSLAYDATALAAVLARNGTASSPYTRDALTNPRGFAGIDGVFRFRGDGLSERGLAVLEIRSGKAVVIDRAPTAFINSGS